MKVRIKNQVKCWQSLHSYIWTRSFLILALVFVCNASFSATQEPIRLKLINVSTATGAGGPLLERYAKQIAASTGGKIAVEVYHSGSLGPVTKSYDLIQNGVADFGVFNPSMNPGRFPLTELITLPGLFKPDVELGPLTEIINGPLREQIKDEYNDVLPFWFAPAMTSWIFTRDTEVKSLQDLKGLKIRCHSAPLCSMLEKVGAIPVVLSPPQIAEALEKKTIDGGVFSPSVFYALKLGDFLKVRIQSVNTLSLIGFAFNRDSFEAQTVDVKDILKGYRSLTYANEYAFAFNNLTPEVGEYLSQKNVKTLTTPIDVKEALDSAALEVRTEYMKKLQGNSAIGQRIVETIVSFDRR